MNRISTTKELRNLLKICGVMDLYEGDCEVMFRVISQCIESKNNQINCLKQGVEFMNQAAKWSSGKW